MHSFERVERSFRSLTDLRMEFDSTKVDANTFNGWLDIEQNLRSELFTTALGIDALNTVASKIAAQLLVLTQYKEAHPDQVIVLPAATSAPSQEESVPETTLHLPGIASARAFDPRRARRRLGGNAWLLYILSAIVLISVGMSTLYAPNVTFGANPLSDYFSIFIFGLGAHTTLASATDLLQRWGVPFTRVNP